MTHWQKALIDLGHNLEKATELAVADRNRIAPQPGSCANFAVP